MSASPAGWSGVSEVFPNVLLYPMMEATNFMRCFFSELHATFARYSVAQLSGGVFIWAARRMLLGL